MKIEKKTKQKKFWCTFLIRNIRSMKHCIRTFKRIQLGVSIYFSYRKFKKSDFMSVETQLDVIHWRSRKKSIAAKKNTREKNTSHVNIFVARSTQKQKKNVPPFLKQAIYLGNARNKVFLLEYQTHPPRRVTTICVIIANNSLNES